MLGDTELPSSREAALNDWTRLRMSWHNRTEEWLPCPIWAVILALLAAPVGVAAAVVGVSAWVWLAWVTVGRALASVVVILAAGTVGAGLVHTMNLDRRAAAWRQAVIEEFLDWHPVRESQAQWRHVLVVGPIGLLKRIVRLVSGVRRDDPESRMTHARRWARLQELASMFLGLGYMVGVFASLTTLLWSYRLVAQDEQVPDWSIGPIEIYENTPGRLGDILDDAANRTLELPEEATVGGLATVDFLHGLADAVPVLELPDTFEWNRPAFLDGQRTQNVLVLAFKLAVVGPGITYVVYVARNREPIDVSDLTPSDPVMSAVADEFATSQRLPNATDASARRQLFGRAATRLAAQGVTPPPGHDAWTSAAVLDALRSDSPA